MRESLCMVCFFLGGGGLFTLAKTENQEMEKGGAKMKESLQDIKTSLCKKARRADAIKEITLEGHILASELHMWES